MSITQQLLLNHGGKSKLEEIETLTLNDLKLKTNDLKLAQKLFEELTSLDELDLSGAEGLDFFLYLYKDPKIACKHFYFGTDDS